MVRSVVGDESQLRSAEDRLLRVDAEVGLLIGKLFPHQRAFVYGFVPTPQTDSGVPACRLSSTTTGDDISGNKKNKKKGAAPPPPPLSLNIDTEWVAEHARQVSRMMFGGLNVIGIYLWAFEDSFFKASNPILCQTVKAVSQFHHDYDKFDERLLLHVSYNPRRWTCRVCSLASTNTTTILLPCDFKTAKLLPSLQSFTCTFRFNLRWPIASGLETSCAFKDVIQIGITSLADELMSAKALIGGSLVTEDFQFSPGEEHAIELLLPYMKNQPQRGSPWLLSWFTRFYISLFCYLVTLFIWGITIIFLVCRSTEVLGHVMFSGEIYASAYLAPKMPVSQIISDIKVDIISSLCSRLDMICEEIEEDLHASLDDNKQTREGISLRNSEIQLLLHEMRKPCAILFPKRVLIPWLPNVFVCDYLKQLETLEDVKDHFKEMMSTEISTETKVLEPEKEVHTLMRKPMWGSVGENSASAADIIMKDLNSLEDRPSRLKANLLVTAVVFLLVSVFATWFIKT